MMSADIVFPIKAADDFNEQAVREEIIAPLVRFLGYAAGTLNNVSYEKTLRYPRAYIGRKNLKKDIQLRGAADYVLDAAGRVRWVIEAKAATVDISIDDIEQAFTYANHPEVRAVFFALCNGRDFLLFQTNQGPDAGPVYATPCVEFEKNKQTLHNILSAESLPRSHPAAVIDVGAPIAPGLGSIAKIVRGFIAYDTCSADIPLLTQMQVAIIGGNVQRYDHQLMAFIEVRSPNRIIQKLCESLGLTDFEMTCPDATISANAAQPSTFVMAQQAMNFPAGAELIDPNTSRIVTIPFAMQSLVSSNAVGSVQGRTFSGRFTNVNEMPAFGVTITGSGNFEIELT